MWAAVTGLLLLAALAILSSFFGADGARAIFNSAPAILLWVLFAFLMLGGPFVFPALRRNLGLLAAHIGVLFVIGGAMWGSEPAHQLRAALGATPKAYKGFLIVPQGRSADRIVDGTRTRELGRLPFNVHLEKFWIDYYPADPGEKWVMTVGTISSHSEKRAPQWTLGAVDWEVGKQTELPVQGIQMRVVERFLTRIGQLPDAPALPVVKMELTRGGKTATQTIAGGLPGVPARLPLAGVFASAAEWFKAGSPTLFMERPLPAVKDYKSTLVIVDGGKEAARKTIEVNKPLHYGGYHFYQHSYDPDREAYTVLAVVSDSGWPAVLAGFLLTGAGVAWHAALTVIRARRRRSEQ